MTSYHHFKIIFLIVFMIGSAVSAWITAIKMKRKVRDTLGRPASDGDLTSLNTWMQIEEKEKHKPLG